MESNIKTTIKNKEIILYNDGEYIGKDIEAAIFLAKQSFRIGNVLYPFTNEDLMKYIDYFENKPSMLSVIASGDQIFNAVLKGTEEVEAFDVNPLAKYYFCFKKAAIETLTREEFIKMFIEKSYMYFNPDAGSKYFDRILLNLDSTTEKFWYELMKVFRFSWYDLFYSNMFSDFRYKYYILANPYLGKEEYQRLRGLLKDTHIAIKDGNILDLADSYSSRKFDLIYLSNIWDYIVSSQAYFEMQEKLKLTPNGYLIAYAFLMRQSHEKLFEEKGCKVKSFSRGYALIKNNC